MIAATDIQTRAADWLLERREGEWNEARQAEFDAWMEESLAHRIAYWRLDAAWGRADLLTAMRRPAFQRHGEQKRKTWPNILRAVAAVLVIGAVAGAIQWFETGKAAEKTYATAIGERERLTLADGSQIELNTDTVLRVATGTSTREVWLDKGEAFFEIKHDAAHPFVVNTGAQRIVDLGTKFTARRNGSQTEVSLLEGRAKIETIGNAARSAILSPGDVAVATAEKVSVSSKTTQDMADELGWQRGMLVFRHTPLAEAAAAFNRYNDKKIVIAGAEIGRLTINGTFPTNATDLFSRAAKDAFGLQVEKQQGKTVISR